MKLTAAQRRVVEHRGRSALVSASAGSGKTTVLAQRCLALVSDPAAGVNIDDLLIVTFTRAAAAELRSRIAQSLRSAAGRSREPRTAAHLRRQIVRLDSAHIGTIDAWCARIVRDHYAELDIDPAFTTLDAEAASLLREHTLDELMEWIATSEDETAAAGRDWLRRHVEPDEKLIRSIVASIGVFLDRLPAPDEWLAAEACRLEAGDPAQLEAEAAALLTAAMRDECRLQREQLDELISQFEDSRVARLLTRYAERLEDWAASEPTAAALRAVADEIDAFSMRQPPKAPPDDVALLARVRERFLKRRLATRWGPKAVKEVLDHVPEATGLARTAIALTRRFVDQLDQAKHERGAFEFADIQRYAYRLLTASVNGAAVEPSDVALALRERYHEILIDECQDTSPVQMAILGRIARSDAGRSNCFYVGDVKQSIYGFRDADPSLFRAIEEDFEAGRRDGEVLPLADNFRTHVSLVAAANTVFACLFDRQFGGADYGSQHALVARRDEIPNDTLDAGPRFELIAMEKPDPRHGGDEEDDEGEPLDQIEREAQFVARRIHALFERGARIPDRTDSGELALRPLRHSDIVVLLRSARSKAYQLAAMLRDEGVPAVAMGREPLAESLEAIDVHAILSLIAHGRQDIPLAAYLRGPAARIEADDLLRIRCHGGDEVSFSDAAIRYAVDGPDAHLREMVSAALANLERWRELSREESAPAIVRRVIREANLESWAAAQPGGKYRVALLRAVERHADGFAADSGGGVAEFAQYLDEIRRRETEVDAPLALCEDAVRVMTIHASKGIEFPVVFLANAGGRFSPAAAGERVLTDIDRGVGVRFLDMSRQARITSASFAVGRWERQRRELEEELRLLYVAVTRARELFVAVGHATKSLLSAPASATATPDEPVSLLDRLAATSVLEWLIAAMPIETGDTVRSACGQFYVEVLGDGDATLARTRSRQTSRRSRVQVVAEGPERAPEWSRQLDHALTAITHRIDDRFSRLPAVASVTRLKPSHGEGRYTPAGAFDAAPSWPRPRFAAGEDVERGRRVGSAVHRFLELANLARLSNPDEVFAQIASLRDSGRITKVEADGVNPDSIAWFGGSDVGRLLAKHAGTAEREIPFAFSLPLSDIDDALLLRGVIDCLVHTDDGLVLIDYKTDRIASEEEFERRGELYRAQLSAYAAVAQQLFESPVRSAWLVFLSARRNVEVQPIEIEALSRRVTQRLTGGVAAEESGSSE